jgi:hypothetical protein
MLQGKETHVPKAVTLRLRSGQAMGHPHLREDLRSGPPGPQGLHMEERSAKDRPEETKSSTRRPRIGQFLAFSLSQVKESGGLNGWLLGLLLNRSGTRIGRFTGPYFGLWVLFIIAMKWIFPTGVSPSDEDAFSASFGVVTVLSLLLLLLNRFDTSGPTRGEFERPSTRTISPNHLIPSQI